MSQVVVVVDRPRLEERMIAERLRDRGLRVRLVNVLEEPLGPGLPEADAVLVRTISMFSGVYAAAYYEATAMLVVNKWRTIMVAGDKALSYAVLAANRIPHPQTLVAIGGDALRKAAEKIGYPLVDKPPIGSWGRLVARIRSPELLEAIAAHRQAQRCSQLRVHIVQEYVETGGADIRCIVVGDELIGCIKRIAPPGEWRSNVALGARTEPYQPDPGLEDLALRTARALDADFISIDILGDSNGAGYLVNEANAIPEFKGFMRATGVDVPSKLADYVKKRLAR